VITYKNKSAMEETYEAIFKKAYDAFNARKIEEVFLVMHSDVQWANGWEGGYVNGYDEVRDYWIRQWKELDPYVYPVSIEEKADRTVEVLVHQVVKDVKGNLLFDGMVKHIYIIENNLIRSMDIEKD
jgi:nuclear transport factor 2 (NTF2) superfamily protein